MHNERINPIRADVALGMQLLNAEPGGFKPYGEVFITLTDSDGKVLEERHHPNVITSDASILAAMLFRSPASRPLGANMLAVGTGAQGPILSPNSPNPAQRKLNAEVARKSWTSTIFRDADGLAVSIPTNIIDFSCTYAESEAIGPLTEMGIFATVSANPLIRNLNPNAYPTRDETVDLQGYDILVNYLTFPVISKPSTGRLTLVWRITY